MLLVMVRHLPTAYNKLGLLQGRRDEPLAPLSAEEGQAVAANLRRLELYGSFATVLVSRLQRTKMTAELYGFSEAREEPLLNELDFGAFEGRPREEMLRDLGALWEDAPRNLVLGESVLQLEERILGFLEKYRHQSSILAFGHGSWMRALLSIERTGSIDSMNRVSVGNNEILEFRRN